MTQGMRRIFYDVRLRRAMKTKSASRRSRLTLASDSSIMRSFVSIDESEEGHVIVFII